MVVRKTKIRDEPLADGVRMALRWEWERDVVSYANVLLVRVEGSWRTDIAHLCG